MLTYYRSSHKPSGMSGPPTAHCLSEELIHNINFTDDSARIFKVKSLFDPTMYSFQITLTFHLKSISQLRDIKMNPGHFYF